MNLNDLLDRIDDLRGFCPELDTVADAFEGLATRTYSRDLRQTVVARLAGCEDDDTVTVLALLVQHLCTTGTDMASMPDADRKKSERYGQDVALFLTDRHLHTPASEASALIDSSAI